MPYYLHYWLKSVIIVILVYNYREKNCSSSSPKVFFFNYIFFEFSLLLVVRSRYSENYIATISCTWEWASKHFLNLYFTWIDYLNNVHTKGSVFFNQSFTNFKNLFLDLISLIFFMYYFVFGGERHKMWKKYIFTLRGVQNFTGADPTDRHQWHRPNYSVDWMSWG